MAVRQCLMATCSQAGHRWKWWKPPYPSTFRSQAYAQFIYDYARVRGSQDGWCVYRRTW